MYDDMFVKAYDEAKIEGSIVLFSETFYKG